MPGAGVSGSSGDVKIGSTSVAEVKKWTFNPKANVAKYASNKTSGYKKAIAGTKEGSGSLECVWDPAIPPTTTINVGTSVTLKLYTTATQFYSVPCVVADFLIVTDIDTGDPVGFTANFEADGQWTDPVAALMFDASSMAQEAPPESISGAFVPGTLMDEATGQVVPQAMPQESIVRILGELKAFLSRIEQGLVVQPEPAAAGSGPIAAQVVSEPQAGGSDVASSPGQTSATSSETVAN